MALEARTLKLALARQKLKDHQEKKSYKSDVGEIAFHGKDLNKKNNYIKYSSTENLNENIVGNVQSKNICIVEKDIQSDNVLAAFQIKEADATEVLISNKRNLEMEINDLQKKYTQLENKYAEEFNNSQLSKQQNINLETELKTLKEKYDLMNDQLMLRDKTILEYKSLISSSLDEKIQLQEQLEFTRALLTTKESENSYHNIQTTKLQKQLEAAELRLQQLSNGSIGVVNDNVKGNIDPNELLMQKIVQLEQQLKNTQKECDQINAHYEHYVSDLNEELKSAVRKNEELIKETVNLTTRENNLIEQMSNMEIQLQNFRSNQNLIIEESNDVQFVELQKEYDILHEKFREMQIQFDIIKEKLHTSENQIKEMEVKKYSEHDNENICISKLHADITNDKIAAQRATEQNRKLKFDLEELEKAFVKMSKDKLELTEKLEAEKFLNRELTIKLAENVDIAKEIQIKIKAKDEEMIRLQSSYREIEKQFELLAQGQALRIKPCESETNSELVNFVDTGIDTESNHNFKSLTLNEHYCSIITNEEKSCQHKKTTTLIPKEDAMLKLQNRFLKIMEEVADLSDEKQRLEHIIMQLQNETDTICEYVALYQQQRSLLKQRDEERNAQIKIFQSECEKMKSQLNELNEIVAKLAKDEELSAYFQKESKHSDISNALNLLNNIKTNIVINSSNQYADLHNLYPCACCSGNIIDI